MKGFLFWSHSKNIQESDSMNQLDKVSPTNQTIEMTAPHSFKELLNLEQGPQITFTGLTEEDIQKLTKLKPMMEKNAPIIVDSFYERLQSMNNLMGIIEKYSTIEKLKQTLRQYLLEMFSGNIGKEYIARRQAVGKVHNRIGLFPEWYIGAYVFIQNEFLRILTLELNSWEEVTDYYQSFMRLCSFDMQIGISTYIEFYTSNMMKLNEVEEIQQRLNDSATSLAASAEETTSSIADKGDLVGEMLDEIQIISKSTKQMIEKVENGKDEIFGALSKVDGVVNLIETTKTLTTELTNSSVKIGQVVQTIRGISNQTNILSLNAAIEAARAGEHGKGFSIVAQEVRTLAQKTEEALDHIQGQIGSVQETIDKFEQSFKQIVDQTSMFRDTNQNIIQILENSVDSVKSSDSRIHHFSSNILRFKQTFEEISTASNQVAEMAEKLSGLNQELSQKFN
ncbi:protoglobin domain-containing protein [Cytobacillus sp. Hz8]|uniref:protoglobin domain-containing protein n=1 Tax=Cytobacillus sp. Hz8 TaxID=3347168 RepID=UPI0035DBD5D1